jgi:hypothetical protein
METLQAIFYVVVILAVTVFTILSAVAVYFAIRILRALNDVAERLKRGSAIIAEDAANFRAQIEQGTAIAGIMSVIGKAVGFRKATRRKKQGGDETTEEN